MGGTAPVAELFDTKYWLLAPTADMQVYRVTQEQLLALVEITEGRKLKKKVGHDHSRHSRVTAA